jgi:hypothetical protein
MKPSTGSSSLGSFATATSRILKERPWLAPVLGLLVIAAAVATWWALAPSSRQPPLVSDLNVVAGFRSVTIAFTTDRAVRATVDVQPTTSRTKLPPPGEPSNAHRFQVTGLREATAHRFTVFFEGGNQISQAFNTQPLLIEGLKKQARLDRLKLQWTTTMAVKSSVVYAAPGAAQMHMDLSEPHGTTHAVDIGGLSPDKDYEVTIVSTTEAGEVHQSSPFKVKLFTTAANEALAEIERAAIPKKIQDVLDQLRRNRNEKAKIAQLLGANLDGLRPPLKMISDIAREFFNSPDVFVAGKLKVYAALKMIEHVERLAKVRGLPFVPMANRIDYGTWAQDARSFGDGAVMAPYPKKIPENIPYVPPPYLTKPDAFPGIGCEQQLVSDDAAPQAMVESRPLSIEADAFAVLGRKADGVHQLDFRFAVTQPETVARAEIWLYYRGASPLQFFELEMNGRGPLVIRPPIQDQSMRWNADAHGVDPALLVPGDNLVRVRLKPIPEVSEGRRAFVWFAELRLKRKTS